MLTVLRRTTIVVEVSFPRQARRKTPLAVVWVFGRGHVGCHIDNDLGEQGPGHRITKAAVIGKRLWKERKPRRIKEAHQDGSQVRGQVRVCLCKGRLTGGVEVSLFTAMLHESKQVLQVGRAT